MMVKAENNIKNLIYFGEFEGMLWNAFNAAAATNRSWKYYHVPINCAVTVAGPTKREALVAAVRAFDQQITLYDGISDRDMLVKFITVHDAPNLMEFGPTNMDFIFDKGRPAIFYFSKEEGTPQQDVFFSAATKVKGDVIFYVSG